MSDKIYNESNADNFVQLPCAQQLSSTSHQFTSYTVPFVSNNGYTIQGSAMYDLLHRNQNTYTPNSLHGYPPEPIDVVNWISDPRLAADIDKIEITSKDLSPSSCCSNIDLFLPEFYKTNAKEGNHTAKPNTYEQQWCYNANTNQKYVEYPSCSQINSDNINKSVKYCTIQKANEYDYNNYNDLNSGQYMQAQSYFTQNDAMFGNYNCNNYDRSRNDQFFPQSEPLPFDINHLERTVDCSNDGSDIIVEESEEEVTDFSEDVENRCSYTSCIICNALFIPLGSQFYMLTTQNPLTMSSQKPVIEKLKELLGIIRNKGNYLCSQCLGLLNTIDHLQLKLESSKTELFNKYEKTCKDNNLAPIPPKRRQKKFKNFCGLHSFKCKLCKKHFSIKKFYEDHLIKHKLKHRFLCEVCGGKFSKLKKLVLHQRTHKETNRKKVKYVKAFQCKICDKPFRTRAHLKEHEYYCSGKLPFKCKHSDCDKKFSSVTKLKNHIKLKHDKKFTAICSICNIGFVKNSDYKSHMISHSTEKKYNCSKCDKSYKTLSNLNYHMKFHSDALPFICEICSKGFMRKEYLQTHINKHKGIRNYFCQFCEKKFVSQKYLDAHLKYHDGSAKKKACNICGKMITNGLEEHLRTHTKLQEFECDLCEIKFNTKGAMSKHKKRKHS